MIIHYSIDYINCKIVYCRGDTLWSPKGRDGTESVPYREAKLTLCLYKRVCGKRLTIWEVCDIIILETT